MNSRRQTVWLVSMLGLMVVLSAYYLFADEADQIPAASEQAENDPVEVIDVGMVEAEEEPWGQAAESSSEQAVGSSEQTAGPSDADRQVIEQLANPSGPDAITTMQMERGTQFSKRIEELTVAMTDEESTEEQIADAINKHTSLMDLEAKLIALEEALLGDYANVAVMYDEDKDHYTVNVHAAQLEKSEAVSIVARTMQDLGIAVHQITVKLIK